MNYFSWIANFGVVPLLLFFALLFLPLFFSFCALLILVAAVRDAIKNSFCISYLTRKFNVFCPHLSKYMLIFVLIILNVHAEESIFLSKGEQYILQSVKINQFSLGNQEVISVKYLKNSSKFLIKAKAIGFSDIYLINHHEKRHIKVYVLSKRQHLKKINAAQSLMAIGLKVNILGEELSTAGVLDNEEQYLTFLEILKTSKQKIHTKVEVTNELRNLIFSKVYNAFYSKEIQSILCHLETYKIFCQYQGLDKLDPYLEFILNQYQISIYKLNFSNLKNYSLKFKIIQVENSNETHADWELSEINQNIKQLMENGININEKTLHLNGSEFYSKILAEPEFLMTLNSSNIQQFGSHIPYKNTNANGSQSTEWKFSGLKIESEFKTLNGKLSLCYKTEFTQPIEESINGNFSQGCLYVQLNRLTHLFNIKFKIDNKLTSSIPVINKIPFLKEIFKSSHYHHSNKLISVFAEINEENND